VKLIKKYDIGIGVSLDGNKEINDKNRIFPNGQGTFDYIIKGINYLKKNNVKFGILSVMTSPKDFNESFKFFVENNYNHIKFNILFKQGRQKETIDDEQQEAFAEAHYNIFKQALKIYKETGRKIKLANISNMLKNIIFFDRPYMCMRSPCGAGSSQLTVDWAGNIYPCEDFLGMDNFILGNIEHINDFKKLKYSNIMEPIKSRTPDKIHECKDCIWQQFCGGGCPLSSYTKYNSFQRKSDLCSYYKTLYKKLFWEIYSNGEMVYKYLFLDKHIKTEE
ncbi:radical SAM protein, partial [bacterium]|nr:radical SAM protein [bacterium]